MKKIKIFSLVIAIAALSTVCSLYAQRGMHGNGGYHGGGGGGFHGGGGWHGGYHGHMGGYNHGGWGARPYFGVATVPFGYGYYGNNCGYVGYWHQWRCW